MHIIVASKNPVKIGAAEKAFAQLFPNQALTVTGLSVPSGVSDQPMTEEETKLGAYNRAQNAKMAHPNADYYVGMEGGISQFPEGMAAFAWMCVMAENGNGYARTASFFLPPAVAELVEQGIELGIADDQVFGQSNSKQQNGAVGLLTHNAIVRESLYTPAVILAMVPFLQADLYLQKPSAH